MNDWERHRPGPLSTFFMYKAAVFAAGFWAWLTVLVVRGGPIGGWLAFAATAAVGTTAAALALGILYALQRDAAARHEEIMRTLVELSWDSFGRTAGLGRAQLEQDASPDGDADVIRLPQESRPRPRR
jgi:hypothetical protein